MAPQDQGWSTYVNMRKWTLNCQCNTEIKNVRYSTSSVKTDHFSFCSWQPVTFQKQKIHSTGVFKISFFVTKLSLEVWNQCLIKRNQVGGIFQPWDMSLPLTSLLFLNSQRRATKLSIRFAVSRSQPYLTCACLHNHAYLSFISGVVQAYNN